MPGSSVFQKIIKKQVYSVTGPTGPTGPRGPDGPDGYGPTGNTGVGISFIGLTHGYFYTELTNGLTFVSDNILRGPSGDTITDIKIESIGNGNSIISSVPSRNSIEFRSIKGITSSTGKSYVSVSPSSSVPSSLIIEYISRPDGFTLINYGSDIVGSFLGTTGSGISFTNIRDTNYRENSASAVFTVSNIFEKTRGLGYTGATNFFMSQGIRCNYVYNDSIDGEPCKTVKIDPACKSDNIVDLLTTNKIYFIDMQNSHGKVIIGPPISPVLSTAFTLIVKNATNTTRGVQSKFISQNGINWPFNIEPCFGGAGETDAYHFYSLYGSWYGSVVYSTKYGGKTFDCTRGEGEPPVLLGACCELDGTLPEGQCGVTCSQKTAAECSGPNKRFFGVGIPCQPNICGFTGACCLTIECDSSSPEDPSDGCYEGITFQDCLCKTFCNEVGDCITPPASTIPDSASTVFHYGVTCGELDNCEGSSCTNYGACCDNGTCTPKILEANCQGPGKKWFAGKNCSDSTLCVSGRCCIINFNHLELSQCYSSLKLECPYSLNENIGVTWTAGLNCADNKCLEIGSCCTGGSCLYPTYRLNDTIVNLFDYIKGSTLIDENPICRQGLCGDFRGPVVCEDTSQPQCENSGSDSQEGLCVIFNRGSLPTIIQNSTRIQCSTYLNSRFYAGFTLGVSGSCCISDCIEGNVPPCYSYTCNNTANFYSFTQCMNSYAFLDPDTSLYIDVGFTLQPCPTNQSDCSLRIPDVGITFPTYPDTVFVGYYYPKDGDLKGKDFKRCCPATYEDLMNGSLENSTDFDSSYDWFGYGITFAGSSDERASTVRFKVFLNTKDLGYTSDGIKITDVIWGQTGGIAWGPRTVWTGSLFTCQDIEFGGVNYHKYLDEGFWQTVTVADESLISPLELVNYTYNKPANLSSHNWLQYFIEDMIATNNQAYSNNGRWRRNWGLYNTMRMFGADNTYIRAQNNGCPNYPFLYTNYILPDEWTSARLIAKLNRENPPPPNSSSWFLPSMDEMAFIAKNLTTINSQIPIVGGDLISGNYWTSTGTFLYQGGSGSFGDEGVFRTNSDYKTYGTQAWVYEVLTSGTNQIRIKKANRSDKYKVRGIRLEVETINEIPVPGTEEYKTWKLSRLKWVDDKLASGG